MSADRIGEVAATPMSARDFAPAGATGLVDRALQAAEVLQIGDVTSNPPPAPVEVTSQDHTLIQAMVDRFAARLNRRMTYEIEPKTHSVIVKILDGETNKVIKTIPPEQWIKLAQRFEETVGLLFDELA